MPKRNRDTLLHIAMREGNVKVLDMVMEFCLHSEVALPEQKSLFLVAKNNDGHAPMSIGLQQNNREICLRLLGHCDRAAKLEGKGPNYSRNVILNCETRQIQLTERGEPLKGWSFVTTEQSPIVEGKAMFQ
eukprot:1871557-Rhodomonas_salina.1